MLNPGVHIGIALSLKTISRIKRLCAQLRREHDLTLTSVLRNLHQGQQKLSPHASPAPGLEHRHAADMRIR